MFQDGLYITKKIEIQKGNYREEERKITERKGKGERGRERERETETEIETDTQTNSQTNRERERERKGGSVLVKNLEKYNYKLKK